MYNELLSHLTMSINFTKHEIVKFSFKQYIILNTKTFNYYTSVYHRRKMLNTPFNVDATGGLNNSLLIRKYSSS